MNDLVAASDAMMRTFCTFRAGVRLYGIDVRSVREVSTQISMTPVAQAPPIVRGLTNLRSQIFLVLDLCAAMGLPPTVPTAESRLIVLHPGVAEHLGLLVDCGGEIVHVRPEQIEATPPESTGVSTFRVERSPLVAGVCKLQAELMMIIDPARFIEATERAIR
jgi:purine-binding chemotaxis protein CheW